VNKRTKAEIKKVKPELFELRKGPNGRNLCRWCQTETKPPRKTFCSAECVHEWEIRFNHRYARQQVRKRDKGICAHCGIDCVKLRKELNNLSYDERIIKAQSLGIPNHRIHRGSLWDLDHIVEVQDGGGMCSLDNYQILCPACHLKKGKLEREKRKANSKSK
jgi:5-methylcytosine-specific restriction endonuclease McrA